MLLENICFVEKKQNFCLVDKKLFATRLMCRLICNLPELSIRIYDPKLIQFIYNKMEAKL